MGENDLMLMRIALLAQAGGNIAHAKAMEAYVLGQDGGEGRRGPFIGTAEEAMAAYDRAPPGTVVRTDSVDDDDCA